MSRGFEFFVQAPPRPPELPPTVEPYEEELARGTPLENLARAAGAQRNRWRPLLWIRAAMLPDLPILAGIPDPAGTVRGLLIVEQNWSRKALAFYNLGNDPLYVSDEELIVATRCAFLPPFAQGGVVLVDNCPGNAWYAAKLAGTASINFRMFEVLYDQR